MRRDTSEPPRRRAVPRGSRLTLGLLGLTLFATLPIQAAFWYESYDQAEKAMAARDWSRAVSLLEQAVSERGASGVGVRTYGVNFIDYFPYLKLGIAHYNLGNYDAALTAFKREEGLGAIANSARYHQELESYRTLAQQARDSTADAERERLVAASLEQAAKLEREGRLEDAMAEVGKTLAIDSDNAAANEQMGRLQAALTVRQEQRDRERRLTGLLADGRRLLAEKKFGEAAGVLAQATQAAPDSSEARDLLAQARSALATELEAQKDSEGRRTMIADGLAGARRLEGSGDYAKAIETVQSVLALDSQNSAANELLERLLLAQDRSERARVKGEGVQALLVQVEERLGQGDYDGSLSLVTRALTTDPANRQAVEMLQRVQRALQRELIGTIGGAALPPQISFLDDRRQAPEQEGDPLVEVVDYPNFTLSGAVYSSSALSALEYAVDGTSIKLGGGKSVELQDGQFMTSFQLAHKLPAGNSTFRILASDSNGKSVSSDYAVLYSAPFYFTTWFFASLLGLLGAVGVATYGRYVSARRRKLRRRFNPYIAGAPVLQENQFFGRNNLMERVLQTIHNNSILLYGERRIGKTSFQHQLKKRLKTLQDPQFQFFPVFIDLQGVPESKFFSTIARDIFSELAPSLNGVQPSAALVEDRNYGYGELVDDVLKVLQALRQNNSRRVKLVLLIDEVDALNSYDPRVNQRLRSLFMRSFAEDLVAVVSGVGIKKEWESEGSPWYNFFEEIEVKPFRQQDAVELIEKPIRGTFKLERGVTERIIALTSCKPFDIQKLCVALVNKAHEERRRTITVADVERVIGRAEDSVS